MSLSEDLARFTTLELLEEIARREQEARRTLAVIEARRPKDTSIARLDLLIEAVEHYYGVPHAAIISSTRTKDVVRARHMVMYLLTEDAGLTREAVANITSKDHSTVIFGIRAIAAELENDVRTQQELSEIRRKVGQHGAQ